jgi:hypothetical protein
MPKNGLALSISYYVTTSSKVRGHEKLSSENLAPDVQGACHGESAQRGRRILADKEARKPGSIGANAR